MSQRSEMLDARSLILAGMHQADIEEVLMNGHRIDDDFAPEHEPRTVSVGTFGNTKRAGAAKVVRVVMKPPARLECAPVKRRGRVVRVPGQPNNWPMYERSRRPKVKPAR